MKLRTRPEISKNNPCWISKHKFLELKHFCLQYYEWKKHIDVLQASLLSSPKLGDKVDTSKIYDPTPRFVMQIEKYSKNMKLVEQCAVAADPELYPYILRAVTEEISFTTMRDLGMIPCCKDVFYDSYHKFFYILAHADEIEFLPEQGND